MVYCGNIRVEMHDISVFVSIIIIIVISIVCINVRCYVCIFRYGDIISSNIRCFDCSQ